MEDCRLLKMRQKCFLFIYPVVKFKHKYDRECCKKPGFNYSFFNIVFNFFNYWLDQWKKNFFRFSSIYYAEIQCMPQKWFVSAICVQTEREIVLIVSQSADPNHFRGTASLYIFLLQVGRWPRLTSWSRATWWLGPPSSPHQYSRTSSTTRYWVFHEKGISATCVH